MGVESRRGGGSRPEGRPVVEQVSDALLLAADGGLGAAVDVARSQTCGVVVVGVQHHDLRFQVEGARGLNVGGDLCGRAVRVVAHDEIAGVDPGGRLSVGEIVRGLACQDETPEAVRVCVSELGRVDLGGEARGRIDRVALPSAHRGLRLDPRVQAGVGVGRAHDQRGGGLAEGSLQPGNEGRLARARAADQNQNACESRH